MWSGVFAALMAFSPLEGWGQDRPLSQDRSLEEARPKVREADLQRLPSTKNEDRSEDLWYGEPGICPGGDLLGPTMDLILHPSRLFDFSPRRVRRYLPDRETEEFLRDRR
jgi:hypothetical protein